MVVDVEEAELVEEETTEETEIVTEAEVEAEVESQEEAVAVEEVAVLAGEDVATRPKEPEALEHSRGPSQTGITPRMNTLRSHLRICNNSLKYEMQETPLEA